MTGPFRSCVSVFLAVVFFIGPTDCRTVLADDHVVSQQDLHAALIEARQNREQSIKGIRAFLASPPVKEILAETHIDLMIKVDQAIPLLTDRELERLAKQAKTIERDIVGAGAARTIGYILLFIGIVIGTCLVIMAVG